MPRLRLKNKLRSSKQRQHFSRPGNPRFEPTQEQRGLVSLMASLGLAATEVRKFIWNPLRGAPISEDAFFRHFRDDWILGKAKADLQVAQALSDLCQGREQYVKREMTSEGVRTITHRALNSMTAAIIWWEKTRTVGNNRASFRRSM